MNERKRSEAIDKWNAAHMTSATPKPSAGEYVPGSTPETDALCSDPAIERRDVPERVWREMARMEAERNLLREALSVIAGEPRQDDTYAGMDKMQIARSVLAKHGR